MGLLRCCVCSELWDKKAALVLTPACERGALRTGVRLRYLMQRDHTDSQFRSLSENLETQEARVSGFGFRGLGV